MKVLEQEIAEQLLLTLSKPRLALARKELVFDCQPEKKGRYMPSAKTSKNMGLRERSKPRRKENSQVELGQKGVS